MLWIRNTYWFLHCNHGHVNTPQRYGIRTLPVLLLMISLYLLGVTYHCIKNGGMKKHMTSTMLWPIFKLWLPCWLSRQQFLHVRWREPHVRDSPTSNGAIANTTAVTTPDKKFGPVHNLQLRNLFKCHLLTGKKVRLIWYFFIIVLTEQFLIASEINWQNMAANTLHLAARPKVTEFD